MRDAPLWGGASLTGSAMVFLLFLLLAVLLPVSETWTAILIIVGGILEIVEVTILRRWSKRLDRTVPLATGPEAMLGTTGEVVEPCTPRGRVRIKGELWDARCDDGAGVGAIVQVDGLDDLVLIVSRR